MKRIRKTKGFTMVELMVTLAITAVLAAIVTLSLIAYTQFADFKRQNEYAQSLFVAAQNALTHYAENGELEDIADTAERYAERMDASMLDGDAATHFQDNYVGRLYSITMNRNGTVNGVNASSTGETALLDVLQKVFEPYVYDKSILSDACITLEFDPVGGVVYSVLYSDKQNAFVYGDDTDNAVSISSRAEADRRERMVGYYGIQTISDLTSREKEKPVIERVQLINEENLRLSFRLTDKYAATATAELTYEISIYGSDSRERMSFEISTIPALYTDSATKPYSEMTVQAAVTTYDADGNAVTGENEPKTYKFVAYVDDDYVVNILLDSIDLAALSTEGDLTETYSFHRFGVDDASGTDNIYAAVRGRGDRYKTSAWKRSNTESAYFGAESLSGTETEYRAFYEIENARHLYNVRFKEAENHGANSVVTYAVTASFAWGGENGIFHGALGSAVFTNGTETQETVDGTATAFPILSSLATNHVMTTTRSSTISGLVLTGGDKTGLFGENQGTISELTLASATVSGGSEVGSFCGVNSGVLVNLTTVGGTVRGIEDVGGIFGKNEAASRTYTNLKNDADVYGTRYVGGITGRLEAADGAALTIVDSSNTGLVLVNTENADALAGLQSTVTEAVRNSGDPSVSSHENGNPGNLFYEFTSMTNDNVELSAADKTAMVRLIEDNNLNGVQGYVGTIEKQVEDLCATLVWRPYAMLDPNGDLKIGGNTYTVIMQAKPRNTEMVSNWVSWLIYYNGNYYGNYNYNHTLLNAQSFSNSESDYGTNAGSTVNHLSSWLSTSATGSAYRPNAATADSDTGTFKNEPAYFGGIVGKLSAATNNATAQAQVTNSTSAPGNGSQETLLADLLAADAEYHNGNNDALPLLGVYVGGIAGYAENAAITGCSTGYGTLVGSHYVGGVAGLSVSTNLGTGQSFADAVGRYYVGGITGAVCTAAANADANDFFVPSDTPSSTATIEGWTNRGAFIATEQYGGGITGYNAGVLTNCGNRTEISAAMQKLAVLYGGDYIGGIAGYNIGNITATNARVTANVSGKNYVGGIVGYNDAGTLNNADTNITGYALSGGYIRGKNFVGGFAGLNVSAALYTGGQTLSANPNLVAGENFVGGVLGGSVIALPSGNEITMSLSANNFLGSLTANAFAGGLIGYNGTAGSIENARTAAKTLAEIDTNNLPDLVAAVDAVSLIEGGTVQIAAAEDSRLQSVTAQLYAAGVLGYNEKNAVVVIANATNRTPVTAEGQLAVNELSAPYTSYNIDEFASAADTRKTYSYAGGIVGKCTANMTLENCSAVDTGRVTARGTYLGGLVEVNEGTLLSCTAASLGDSTRNYVGGLVGLNKPSGKLEKCTLGTGVTVIGSNMVGGLVSENFGKILGKSETDPDSYTTTISGTVIGGGTDIGGITGRSLGEVSGYTLALNVSGNGTNVGGAVGENMGGVSEISYSDSGSYAVSGTQNVGGILGVHDSFEDLNDLVNRATVTANSGSVGGVVGVVRSGTNSGNCGNEGAVQVLGGESGSAAGGFTGTATGIKINGFINSGTITAHRGVAGGVVGTAVGTEITGGSSTANISGYKAAGGAAGTTDSKSTITSFTVRGCTISAATGVSGATLGGIAGQNAGIIEKGTVTNLKVDGDRADIRAGGIAGENSGTVKDSEAVDIQIAMTSDTNYGYLGGAVGRNTGTVSGLKLSTISIAGRAGNPQSPALFESGKDYENSGVTLYGYGGVAGINGSDRPGGAGATIRGCKITNLTLTYGGSTSNVALAGGVTGVNGVSSLVNGITFSETNSVTNAATGSLAHVGGVTGCNFGAIENIGKKRADGFGDGSTVASETARKASADTETVFTLRNDIGHLGGIVGYNKSAGSITKAATGTKWTITTAAQGQDTATGGIIGYNTSSATILSCDNWASVSKTGGNSVGGITGRMEATSGQWRFTDCNNFGDVTGVRAGGVIGNMKFNGGTVEGCTNYGTITSRVNGEVNPAGGIIGMMYSTNAGAEVHVISSANFGSIAAGTHTGGIIGDIGFRCHRVRVTISDCVNTGIIDGGSNRGGMVGHAEAGSGLNNTMLSMRNCRNYGRAVAGMVGNHTASASKTISIENCFGVAGVSAKGTPVSYPIANVDNNANVTIDNCFYFTDFDQSQSLNGYRAGTPLYLEAVSGTTDTYNAYEIIAGEKHLRFANVMFAVKNAANAFDSFMNSGFKTLVVTGTGSNNARQSVYLGGGLDAALNGETDEEQYKNVKLAFSDSVIDNGGSVSVSWTVTEGGITPYKYRVYVTVDGTTTTYDTFEQSFSYTTANLLGKEIKFEVCAVSPTEQVTSSLSDPLTYTVPSAVLPTPQIRFVLNRTSGSGGQYDVELLNAADYDTFGTVTVTVEGRRSDDNGHAFSGGATRTITVQNGVVTSTPTVTPTSSPGTNYRISTYATSAAGSSVQAARSATVTRETMMPQASTYLGSTAFVRDVQFIGFAGTTAQELTYKITMKRPENMALTYKSVLTAVDTSTDGLGVPVIYGESQVSLSSAAAANYLYVADIGNLPIDFNDLKDDGSKLYQSMTVTSYPYHFANDLVYTETELGVYTAEEIKALRVNDNGAVDETGTLLVSGEGNARTLKAGYSLTLNADGTYTLSYSALLKGATAASYTNVKKEAGIDGSIPTLAKPEITVTYDALADSYVAEVDGTTAGGNYSYTLVGTTADGATVPIKSEELTNAGQTFRIEESTASWAYTSVTLTVERIGTVNADGITTAFGSTAVEETKTKLKLSGIAAPIVTQVNKDDLIYNVSWSSLASSVELDALEKYEVTLKTTVQTNGEGATSEVTAVYYAEAIDGTVPTTLQIDMDNVSGKDSMGNTVSGFVPGDADVELSVRAIAKAASETYTDGPAGVSTSFELPTRLTVPKLDHFELMSGLLEVLPTDVVSIQEFEDTGFTLTYTAGDTSYAEKVGKLQLAVEVVETDGTQIAALSTKENPFEMEGMNLDEASTLQINKTLTEAFTADYSGKSLRIAARAVSDSEVSSLWSDTKTFPLPKVQVDAVALTASLAESLDLLYQNGEALDGVDRLSVNQNSFSFTQGRYASGFTATLTRYETIEGSETEIRDEIEVSYENNLPVVKYTDGAKTYSPTDTKIIAPTTAENGTYIYTLGSRMEPIVDASGAQIDNYAVELQYTLTVAISADGTVTYTLLLPDAQVPAIPQITDSVQKDAFTYRRVAIGALAESDQYVDGRFRVAYRETDTSPEYTLDEDTYLTANGSESGGEP